MTSPDGPFPIQTAPAFRQELTALHHFLHGVVGPEGTEGAPLAAKIDALAGSFSTYRDDLAEDVERIDTSISSTLSQADRDQLLQTTGGAVSGALTTVLGIAATSVATGLALTGPVGAGIAISLGAALGGLNGWFDSEARTRRDMTVVTTLEAARTLGLETLEPSQLGIGQAADLLATLVNPEGVIDIHDFVLLEKSINAGLFAMNFIATLQSEAIALRSELGPANVAGAVLDGLATGGAFALLPVFVAGAGQTAIDRAQTLGKINVAVDLALSIVDFLQSAEDLDAFEESLAARLADLVDTTPSRLDQALTGRTGEGFLFGDRIVVDGIEQREPLADRLSGGGGADQIFGERLSDALYGRGGPDGLFGGSGDDFLSGGAGRDNLNGGLGDDTLFAGSGNDFLNGQDGNDILLGEGGADILVDHGERHTLDGGAGHDRLYSGPGSTGALYGGPGRDFAYAALEGGATGTIALGGRGALSNGMVFDGIESLLITGGGGPRFLPQRFDFIQGRSKEVHLSVGTVAGAYELDFSGLNRGVFQEGSLVQTADGKVSAQVFTSGHIFTTDPRFTPTYTIDPETFFPPERDNSPANAAITVLGSTKGDDLGGDRAFTHLEGNAGHDTLTAFWDRRFSDELLSAPATLLGGAGQDLLRAAITGEAHEIDGGRGRDAVELTLPVQSVAPLTMEFTPGQPLAFPDGTVIENVERLAKLDLLSLHVGAPDVETFEVAPYHLIYRFDPAQPGLVALGTEVAGASRPDGYVVLDLTLDFSAFNAPAQMLGLLPNAFTAFELIAGPVRVEAGVSPKRIIGGQGDDILFNAHRIDGGQGDDVLGRKIGDVSHEALYDTFSNARIPVTLNGGDGNDLVQGWGLLRGGKGSDVLDGYGRLIGGAGSDSLTGIGRLEGNAGRDVLTTETRTGEAGQNLTNILLGGVGADTLRASRDTDALVGGPGRDLADFSPLGTSLDLSLVDGTWSDDLGAAGTVTGIENVTGGGRILGDGGRNVLKGLFGADELSGGGGNDTLAGGDGRDLLIGGPGADLVQGGDGEDRVIAGPGQDTLRGGADIDTVDYAAFTVGIVADLRQGRVEAGGVMDQVSGFETLIGTGSADRILGDRGENSLFGGAGRDLLSGRDGDDVLDGGAGRDTLMGGAGNDRLLGGAGGNLFVGGPGADILTLGPGPDIVRILALSDSNPAQAIRDLGGDTVWSFDPGADLIDLRALDADITTPGDQAFTLAAGETFSGMPGELIHQVYVGSARLLGDVDGDGEAEFSLWFHGPVALTPADILA